MREMFQTALMHLALCGLAASIALLVLRSHLVRDAFARLVSIWRSLTAFGRVAVCSFLLIGILIGGDKTNNVPPNMNSPLPQIMQGGIIQGGAASCRAGDLRNDSFIWRGGTPHLLGTLPNSGFAEWKSSTWNVCGAWKDSFWLPFEDEWAFPHGTNHLSGVEVVSYGEVWATPFGDAVASLGVPVEIVPGLSSFAFEQTPSNSYRFAWTDAAINRDTNNLVTASIELFRSGDTCVTTNGVAAYLPRELPFEHHGYGQDAEWVTANFTNATEILSVGYPQWVDAQVGTSLTNGLYKLAVTVADDPPETTLISVGDLSVAVTNAGEYVFLLEKGPDYDFAVFPPSSNVTMYAVDDIAATRGVAFRSFGNGGDGTWTPDGGNFQADYAPGMGYARFWWLPWLCGSPDVTHIGLNDEVTFTAVLGDCRRADGAAFHWTASEGLSLATPNAQSTAVAVDSMPSWASAYASVTATFGDRSLTSYLDLSYGTNSTPQVHLSLNVPAAVLLNSNTVSAAKIAAAGWSFSSDAPTNGVVRVTCPAGGERVSAPALLGEWEVDDGCAVDASIEGVAVSESVGDVAFRMEFVCGGSTNAVERPLTVVRVGGVLIPSAPADGLVVLTNTPVAMSLGCEPVGADSLLSTTWHTRRLKADGTYAEWMLAAYGQPGATFVFTPTHGGIYQVRALASVAAGGADERFYVWDADEPASTGIRKRGDLKAFGVCDEQWQIDLRNCAKSYLGSTDYALMGELDGAYGFATVPDGSWKCNYFVAYRIREAGLPLLPQRQRLWRQYPPLANDWANGTFIPHWSHLPSLAIVQPGYISGHPAATGSGHVGIVDFDGECIAAGAENVNRQYPHWKDGTCGFNKHNPEAQGE